MDEKGGKVKWKRPGREVKSDISEVQEEVEKDKKKLKRTFGREKVVML